jgi:hypothetical protein
VVLRALRTWHLSPLTLLLVCSGCLTLALGGGLLFAFVSSARQDRPSTALPGNTYISAAQTASGVRADGSPSDAQDDFAINQTVYITYLVSDAGPGTVIINVYVNNSFFASTEHTFPQRSSYNGYFRFQAPRAGNWEADLYWRAPGAGGDGILEQRVTFLVGANGLRGGAHILCPPAL